MSSRTRGVAVAVKAMTGTQGKWSRNSVSWRYSGRKSCPHSLMQWASSIAMRPIGRRPRSAKTPGTMSRSGARYRSRKRSSRKRRRRSWDSAGLKDEFR